MESALELLLDATRHQRHREDVDFSFHLAVTEAANNHYYSSTMQALKEHIFVGMHMHGLSLVGVKAKLQNVLEEHRAIYDAIANRQPREKGQCDRGSVLKARATGFSKASHSTCPMTGSFAPSMQSIIFIGRFNKFQPVTFIVI